MMKRTVAVIDRDPYHRVHSKSRERHPTCHADRNNAPIAAEMDGDCYRTGNGQPNQCPKEAGRTLHESVPEIWSQDQDDRERYPVATGQAAEDCWRRRWHYCGKPEGMSKG